MLPSKRIKQTSSLKSLESGRGCDAGADVRPLRTAIRDVVGVDVGVVVCVDVVVGVATDSGISVCADEFFFSSFTLSLLSLFKTVSKEFCKFLNCFNKLS